MLRDICRRFSVRPKSRRLIRGEDLFYSKSESGSVVGGFGVAGEIVDVFDDAVDELFWPVAMVADELGHSFDGELFGFGVNGFDQAVGNEEEGIALIEGDGGLVDFAIEFVYAHEQVSGVGKGANGLLMIGGDSPGFGAVTAVDIGQFTSAGVIECDEDCGETVFGDDLAEGVVELPEEVDQGVAFVEPLLEDGFDDSGDERGSHAVSADVGEEDGDGFVVIVTNVEIVASDGFFGEEAACPVETVGKGHVLSIGENSLLDGSRAFGVFLYAAGVVLELPIGGGESMGFFFVVVFDAADNHEEDVDQQEQQDGDDDFDSQK